MRDASKFLQQRLQMLHYSIVHLTAAGNDPVVILQIGRIISHWQTEKIGQPAARLLEYDLRSASVPELCARARVYIEVARVIDYQADL